MDALFLQVVDMTASASILVGVVILLRLALRKAPKAIHCALWAMVALRLVCPSLPESPVSLMPDSHPVTSVVQQETEKTPGTDQQPQVQLPQASAPNNVATTPAEPEKTVDWAGILTGIWLAGVGVMALYGIGSYLYLRRKVAPAVKEDGVWLCDHVASPFILGLLRPRIYLPSGLEEDYRASVLAHEQAHIRRGDHWWKPLGFGLLAVHWFNPVMWLAYVLLCRDIEAACDEKVVKGMDAADRRMYSEALLRCAAPRRSIAACPLAFGEQGIKGRIKSVLSYKKPTLWIILVALVASVAVGVFFLTDPLGINEEELKPPTGNRKVTTSDRVELRNQVPDYFEYENQDLEVFVWEENRQIWCGLVGHSDEPITQEKINALTAVRLETMKYVLRSVWDGKKTLKVNYLGELNTLKQSPDEEIYKDAASLWVEIQLGLDSCKLYGENNLQVQRENYYPTGDSVSQDQLGLCLAENITITTCIYDPYEEVERYNVYTVKNKDLSYLVVAEKREEMVYELYKTLDPEEIGTDVVWVRTVTGTVAFSLPGHPAIEEDCFYFITKGGRLYRVEWPHTEQLYEGQTLRIEYHSDKEKTVAYAPGDDPPWKPEIEFTANNVEELFLVYFKTQYSPISLEPSNSNEYYSETWVTAKQREYLLNIEQDRVWHNVMLSGSIPSRSRVFNVVVDGKWNFITLYGDNMILRDKYYSMLTEEEEELFDVIINWGYKSDEAKSYFTDDYLVNKMNSAKS